MVAIVDISADIAAVAVVLVVIVGVNELKH